MKSLQISLPECAPQDYMRQNPDVSLKVFLATAPQSHPPTAPHPALPYLKGYLREVLPNASVTQKDLDAVFFSYIFSPEELAKRFSPEEAVKIRAAYEAQRDIGVYRDVPRFIEAHQTLESAIDEISRQQKGKYGLEKESLRLRGNTFTYVSEYPGNDPKELLAAISPENREKNFFYQYFKERVVPHIIDSGYDVVGLSDFLTDQLVPTFLLASMIKEANPSIRVVVGGNYVSRFDDTFSENNAVNQQLFNSIDAIVWKEGELPFKKILEVIGKTPKGTELNLEGINQVIYKSDGKIKSKLSRGLLPQYDLNTLPRPYFEGIFTNLDESETVFWAPSPVISLYTERGCPFVEKNCDFCAIPTGNNVPNSKLSRSVQKVAEDMEFYREKYNTQYFSFGNETLTRRFMVGLSEELEKRGLEAVIDGYTRTDQFIGRYSTFPRLKKYLESSFLKPIVPFLKKIGLFKKKCRIDNKMVENISKYFRFLQIGFESGDEETLDSMAKGRKPFRDNELAKALFENKIYPHAFLMTGFPPEKEKYEGKGRNEYVNFYVKSALATLKWLIQNKNYVGTYKNTRLVLPRDSKMVELGKDGVSIKPKYSHEIKIKPPRNLEYNIPHNKINGSRKLDEALTELFDLIETPYRAFTHHAIYHQRQFMWEEGIRWSLGSPYEAHELAPISEERVKKVLKNLWNAAVGQDYTKARNELERIGVKGGRNAQEKRERLQKIINETQEKNIIAKKFPNSESLTSIEELLKLEVA